MTTAQPAENRGFLGFVERVGNKIPHPLALFLWIVGIVLVLTLILDLAGVSAVHPQTGETLHVHSQLAPRALVAWFENFATNLQNFRVLAVVLILAAATGLCEYTGLFHAAIRTSLKNVSGTAVVFAIAFIGACSNIVGDVAFLIVPTIAATIFYNTGRHPLVGMFLGYGAVGGGYGTNIVPGGWDLILTPITVDAARIIDPGFDMHMITGYYMMVVGTFVVAITATIVTTKFLEPRFGAYTPDGPPEGEEDVEHEVTPEQHRALRRAGIALGLFLLAVVVLAIPSNSILRSDTGSLIVDAPLMRLLFSIIMIAFILPGLVYGYSAGTIGSIKDVAVMMNRSIATVAPFVVIAIIIAQFLYLFTTSNLGTVLAINGGSALKSMAVPSVVVLLAFFILEGVADLFIISGSSRYLIFGPVFVPMLMQLGVHPAMTQMVHRMGGSLANHLSPLNSFFPLLLALGQKYDRRMGIGTVFSAMLPFTIGYAIAFGILIGGWFILGLPTGPGTPSHFIP